MKTLDPTLPRTRMVGLPSRAASLALNVTTAIGLRAIRVESTPQLSGTMSLSVPVRAATSMSTISRSVATSRKLSSRSFPAGSQRRYGRTGHHPWRMSPVHGERRISRLPGDPPGSVSEAALPAAVSPAASARSDGSSVTMSSRTRSRSAGKRAAATSSMRSSSSSTVILPLPAVFLKTSMAGRRRSARCDPNGQDGCRLQTRSSPLCGGSDDAGCAVGAP